jgi:hypothetical protein
MSDQDKDIKQKDFRFRPSRVLPDNVVLDQNLYAQFLASALTGLMSREFPIHIGNDDIVQMCFLMADKMIVEWENSK